MTKNTKYLELYRRLETSIKKSGKYNSVKEYEDSLESNCEKQNKIRMCRLIRNYLEHENTTFLDASDQMIEFIEKLAIEFDEENIPVKKKMFNIKNSIKDTDLITTVANYMTKKKLDIVPIFNKNDVFIGVCTYESIVKYLATGDFTKTKKVSNVLLKYDFEFINENTPMNQVRPLLEEHKKVYLVVNDKEKIVGWII